MCDEVNEKMIESGKPEDYNSVTVDSANFFWGIEKPKDPLEAIMPYKSKMPKKAFEELKKKVLAGAGD